MNKLGIVAVWAACSALYGCAATSEGGGGRPDVPPIDPEAAAEFEQALAELRRLDALPRPWTGAECQATASMFQAADDQQKGSFLPALFNAGVAHQRCLDVARARPLFEQVLEQDPKFHRARVELSRLLLAEKGDAAIPEAMAGLERAVLDSDYQNVEALVELARLQMRRGGSVSDKDGANDLERAKKNLQRALAVDDAYLPAQNQLALYYLSRAKRGSDKGRGLVASGGAQKNADTQAIDLALLVATQGLAKNSQDASLLNTTGLILVETGDLPLAVKHFKKAREVDPRFFEAHMNYAAVNLSFRGFAEAEAAYRSAAQLRPKDYDAALGVALALRAQIDGDGGEGRLAEAEKWIGKAKEIDAARPEAYFNHAILVEQYKTRSGGEAANRALGDALGLYQEFVKRAQGKPELSEVVFEVSAVPQKPESQCLGPKAKTDRACKRGRMLDVRDTIDFNKQTLAEQKRLAEEAKTRAALDDAGTVTKGDAP